MFLIHADQVQAFAALGRASFERRAAALVGHWLGAVPPEGLVRASVDRAFTRGIETEPEVLQHVAIECLLRGDLLEAWPWAAEVLDDPYPTALGKLRTILRSAAARGVDVLAIDHCAAIGGAS
jgi:hypothetical protein